MLSHIAQDHVSRPRNVGPLEDATSLGEVGVPGEGPYMQIWLKIESGVITRAAYRCNSCPSTIASASMAAQIVIGRPADKAVLLTPADLELLLQGLPEGKGHCAIMAIEALRSALRSVRT